jgi:hypothetical protein
MKIKNRDITDRFIEKFENGKPFTPPEKRMMGIKLAQLKKDTKAMLDDGTIESDKEVEEIIMDAISYAEMVKPNIRSMASLGYGIVPESITYFQRKQKMQEKIDQEKEDFQRKTDNLFSEEPVSVNKEPTQPERKKKSPDWLRDDL